MCVESPGTLVKMQVLIQQVAGGAGESAFLTGSPVIQPVFGLYFEHEGLIILV